MSNYSTKYIQYTYTRSTHPHAKYLPEVLSIIRTRNIFNVLQFWYSNVMCIAVALRRVKLKSELFPKLKELLRTKVLGEEVCWIFSTFDKEEFYLLFFNELPNKMITNINVLRAALLYGIRPDED